MATTPTARSLAYLRKLGMTAGVVERYCHHTKRRIDFLGGIDLIGTGPVEGIVAVQSTSASNQASRVTKLLALPTMAEWLKGGGRLVVHGWSKKGAAGKRKLWSVNVTELTLDDFLGA
jgi:hypothetical protein